MKGINIVDVLSKKTPERPEADSKNIQEQPKKVANPSDFDDAVEDIMLKEADIQQQTQTTPPLAVQQPQKVQAEVVEEEDVELDSEQTAEALIDMVDIVQKGVFVILGAKKIKKNIPEDLMRQFEAVDVKFARGEELTDKEKIQHERYLAMIKRLEILGNTVPFTDEERQQLLAATEVFAKKSGIKIPPGAWFGAQMASVISSRVIDYAML